RKAARVERLAVGGGTDLSRACIDHEIGTALAEAEKYQGCAALDCLMPGRDRLPIELGRIALPDQRPQVGERQDSRRRIAEEGGDPRRIPPPLARAVERVARKTIDLFHRAARLVASRSRRNCAGCPATPIRPSRCACSASCDGSS